MSSYANSFFHGDWHAAHAFNPVVERYVPAMASLLRTPTQGVLRIGYEDLVTEPTRELASAFAFLGLPDEPEAVDYGKRFAGETEGAGDPIGVGAHDRPVTASVEKWVAELSQDHAKLALARAIVAKLDPDDVRLWGFEHTALFAPLDRGSAEPLRYTRTGLNGYVLQRRLMLALKKDIHQRPLGRLVERVRYYCNVLLRE